MKKFLAVGLLASVLVGCAQTDIQPLTQTSFMVSTRAAPACGPTGARTVANKAAAIEVIQRGGDRFVFGDSRTGSQLTGLSYNAWTGVQAQNVHNQSLMVQMVDRNHPQYADSFSARELLGPEWQKAVTDGVPNTCS
jgi:hypothetical protein